MGKYILKRLLWIIVTVLGTAFTIFNTLHFTSGGPAVVIVGGNASAPDAALMWTGMGIDRSHLAQLGSYSYNTFTRTDFGNSWIYDKPVYQEMLVCLPRTILIGVSAIVLSLGLSLYLGIFAATHEGKRQDPLTMAIAMILISCPDSWVALVMIPLPSAKLGWLPSYEIGGPQYYVMPIICSALGGIAVNARQARASMLGIFREDYIITARVRDQYEKMVVLKHTLPNALMPIITPIGAGFARIVAGSAVIKSVFSVPGAELYMLNAINIRDHPIVRACVLFPAAFIALVMLAVDLTYALIDPRIKAQCPGVKKGKAVKT